MDGQGHCEGAAFAFLALDLDLSVVKFNHGFGNRKTQAHPLIVAREAGFYLVEAVKNMAEFVLWDADTGIPHRNPYMTVFLV